MNRANKPNHYGGGRNNKLCMNLKDIVRENALHFLPAKSLVRLRTVCQDWKLKISSPFFEHNQSLSFRAIQGIFCQSPGAPPIFIPFDPSSCGVPDPSLGFLPGAVDIRSSCNGLLLCQSCSGDKAYYVCNPVTKKFKKIPKPTADHGREPAVVIVFEPSLLNFEAEYKIVCAFRSADFDDAIEFEIYSSRDGSWTTSGEICFGNRSSIPKQGIYANGVIYFTLQGGCISYDIAKDRSQLIKNFYMYGLPGSIGVVNGKVCSAKYVGHTLILSRLSNIHSNTMEMGSTSRMWEEQCRITLGWKVVRNNDPLSAIFDGGDALVFRVGGRLFSCDNSTKVIRELSKPHIGYPRVVPYVNSLVSI